jgi:transposase
MDLRECLGEQILLKLALDAVQSLPPSELHAAVGGPEKLRQQMMLTLLSYCYAIRTYGSHDIEWAIRHDPTVRYICARSFPDWHAIRQFRRNNRALVEQCLAYVLKKAWILQADEIEDGWAMGGLGYLGLQEKLAAEVSNKLDAAILLDGVDRD